MGVGGSVIVFIIAWWLAFIPSLSVGVRAQGEEGDIVEGTDPAAPIAPNLGRKAIWATIIATIVWAALYAVVEGELVSIDDWADFIAGPL